MRSFLSLVFLISAAPAGAATIDLDRARVVATFEEFNLTSNLVAQDGTLIIPDSQRDVLLVRGLRDGSTYDIPLSVAMANFVAPIGGGKVAISDPANDRLSIVDLATRREVSSYTFQDHFGPWHLAEMGGVIYGSNKFDRTINRYSVGTRRQLSNFEGGSGPSFLAAHHGLLFVSEQGGIGTPGDDHIAWYVAESGELGGRELLEGSVNELTAWEEGVCMTLGYADKVQCGYPEKGEWMQAETEVMPWGIAIGERQIWVLTRGDETQEPMIITYGVQNGALARLAAWKLRGVANLENPRSLAFDARTRTLLVRGNKSVVAFPVINWE